MRRITYLFGTLVAIGLLALGCDSVTEPATDDSTPVPAAAGVTSPSLEGDVITITEEDLGPSDRPEDFGEEGYEAPEEDWFTPTHDDPLNTDGAIYGFFGAPHHKATFGDGSFLFDVPAGERSWILTDKYGTGEWHGEPDAKEGTKLSEITALKYSTFISEEFPENGEQVADVVPSLQIMAFNEDGSYLGLVFDPPSEAETDEWQRWDVMEHNGWRTEWDGRWEFDEEGNQTGGPDPLDDASWQEVTNYSDNAVIGWSIGIAAGTWPGKDFHGYADLLTVGVEDKSTTTYNFDVGVETKDDCKGGGWEDLGFKNQGQCIRSVNTKKTGK